jgi:hypothetical protein
VVANAATAGHPGAMLKLGSLLDQQGKKREAKAVAAQSGSAGQQPWRRPTYEHHGPGGASEPGAYASWKWNWEIESGTGTKRQLPGTRPRLIRKEILR